MRKILEKLHKEQRGITGLETAIILIAFVVVASVFAYVVLSAGFLATDTAKGTIVQGLSKTRGTLELRGSVVGRDKPATAVAADQKLSVIEFTVAMAIPGESMQLNAPTFAAGTWTAGNTIISYWDKTQKVSDVYWTRTFLYDANGNSVLDGEDLALISVYTSTKEDGTTALTDPHKLTTDPGANTESVIEVKPPRGGVLVISRVTPPAIDLVTDLH